MASPGFLSYVRENALQADRLKRDLEARGIAIWLDRYDIVGGQRWPLVTLEAIAGAPFFIACFSAAYDRRTDSQMNEELNLASERLRRHHLDLTWLIPVKLDPCNLPAFDIGGGHLLSKDLHYLELYPNWEEGINKLVAAILNLAGITPTKNLPPIAPSNSAVAPENPSAKVVKQTSIKIGKANVGTSTTLGNQSGKPGADESSSSLSVEIGDLKTKSLTVKN